MFLETLKEIQTENYKSLMLDFKARLKLWGWNNASNGRNKMLKNAF